MDSDLYTLLYVSTATHLMEDSELLDLLEESREKNKRLSITGMLLYCEGTFTGRA